MRIMPNISRGKVNQTMKFDQLIEYNKRNISEMIPDLFLFFKGATKLYFTHYSCVVIILFNMGLYKSVFSMDSFGKLVFLSFRAFCVFRLLCIEFNLIFLIQFVKTNNVNKRFTALNKKTCIQRVLELLSFKNCIHKEKCVKSHTERPKNGINNKFC